MLDFNGVPPISLISYFEKERENGMASLLSERYSEGLVEKLILYREPIVNVDAGDVYEITILRLEPGAEIKKHRHTFDEETYILMRDGVVLHCQKGAEHGLRNSDEEELYVLAIKRKTDSKED